MEPKSTQITIVSKKKNYDDVNNEELATQIATLRDRPSEVTHVNISGNSYSADFCEQFGEIVKKLSALEAANYNDIFVGRKKDEIPRSLESLTGSLLNLQVHSLDLSNNAVGPNGAAAIANYLENNKSLKVFVINNCGLGIMGATTIGEAFKRGKANLSVLSMSRNRLEDKGTIAISAALKDMTNIREVQLFQDVIRQEGMNVLLDALTGKPGLETVDISDNFISEESIGSFCTFLEKTPSLKNLNVSDCNLELDLSKKAIDALEKSEAKLEKLGFNYAELSDTDYAKRLLDILLVKNPNLKRVDIKGNEFKKTAQQYYKEKAKEQIKYYGFESGDEDEDDELAREFSSLRI